MLLVEDNPGDAELVADLLDELGAENALVHVQTMAAARMALREQPFEVVLLDLRLPDCEGVDCVKSLRGDVGDAALVVLTGADDDDALAIACIAAGAQTYIEKSEMRSDLLRRAIAYSIARVREAISRRRADALREQLILSQRLDLLGKLARGIAHDLNNTLQPILVIAPSLEARVEDPELREGISMIVSATRRAKELVREIVRFGRESVGEDEVVQLDDLVRATLPMLATTMPANVTYTIDADPVPGLTVSRSQIYQVVLNLVTNAIQALEGRPGRVEVQVTSDSKTGPVRLIVEDNGKGMTEEVMANAFEPNFTTKQSGEGSGLGLSVVAEIIRRCGAAIGVTSTPNRGSRFEVVFPVATGEYS